MKFTIRKGPDGGAPCQLVSFEQFGEVVLMEDTFTACDLVYLRLQAQRREIEDLKDLIRGTANNLMKAIS